MTVSLPPPSPMFLDASRQFMMGVRSRGEHTIPPRTWTALTWDTVLYDPAAGCDRSDPTMWRVPMDGFYEAGIAPFTIEHREPLVVSLAVMLDGVVDESTAFTRALHTSPVWPDERPGERPPVHSEVTYAALFGGRKGQRMSLAIHHCGDSALTIDRGLSWFARWLSP